MCYFMNFNDLTGKNEEKSYMGFISDEKLKHGPGKLVYKNGTVIEGMFKNGKPHGYVEIKYENHSKYREFSGIMENGIKNGLG